MDDHLNLPLQKFRVFESRHLDEARDAVARVFCPHELSILRPHGVLDARMHSVSLNHHVSLNYVQYGAGVQIEPGYLTDFFLLQMPLRGSAQIRCGAQYMESTVGMASLPSPTEPLSMRWGDDCPQLILRIDRVALQVQLASMLDACLTRALVFDLAVDLSQPDLSSMAGFVHYLRGVLDTGQGLCGAGPLADQAASYLMTCLLLSSGHNYKAELDRGSERRLMPRAVRRAKEFMAHHVQEAISLADVSREVGCSARALQLAFRNHVSKSPMEFLRELRLAGVRAELQAKQAPAPSVAEVAAKYGFMHLGHFSAQYREHFGERPSDTHRRCKQ